MKKTAFTLAITALLLTGCKKETTTIQTVDGEDTVTTVTTTVASPDILPDSAERAKIRIEAQTKWEKAKADLNEAIAKGDKKAEEAARKTEAEAREAWDKIKADTKEAREDLKEGYNNALEKAKID